MKIKILNDGGYTGDRMSNGMSQVSFPVIVEGTIDNLLAEVTVRELNKVGGFIGARDLNATFSFSIGDECEVLKEP